MISRPHHETERMKIAVVGAGIAGLDMNMGQWLCVPMIVADIGLWVWASKKVATT